jgi:hypothetical protein
MDKTVTVSERGQITDRFSKAIEQLGRHGAESVDLRLGGIYALEQIARDSRDWYRPVMEVLAAFVRQHASGLPMPQGETRDLRIASFNALPSNQKRIRLSVDVAAAVDVLGRRSQKEDAPAVDLDGTDFCRVEFSTTVDFRRTSFVNARLQYSRLMFADLRDCHVLSANLEGCDLVLSDLRGARVVLTTFYGADLEQANLQGTRMQSCDLRGALNLTIDQLKVAEMEDTTLPIYIDAASLAAAKAAAPPAP